MPAAADLPDLTVKPTHGPWEYMPSTDGGPLDDEVVIYLPGDGSIIIEGPNATADALLVAEAGNVLHETGLSPRQLADQRRELLVAIKRLTKTVEATADLGIRDEDAETLELAIDAARFAIARAEGRS